MDYTHCPKAFYQKDALHELAVAVASCVAAQHPIGGNP
jgi:hypothetical protein